MRVLSQPRVSGNLVYPFQRDDDKGDGGNDSIPANRYEKHRFADKMLLLWRDSSELAHIIRPSLIYQRFLSSSVCNLFRQAL